MSLFVQDLTKYLGVLAWYWSGAFFNLISDLKKSFLSQITLSLCLTLLYQMLRLRGAPNVYFFFDLGAPF